ncbi:hypothetical protein H5410_037268 [Solanum commersonii]|uniref:Integrase core domain containing protein n=1 Tax=Solanum commersonii TaxID=4109 RepID=A0A9J5Y9Q7_SOLCO|nr:hypothetical protein H5410_037268 [Solanum commersonii]
MSRYESAHASGSESAHSSRSEFAHAAGSNAKSSTGSGENDQAASSDEATSLEFIPSPRNDDPTPIVGELNRVLTGSLHTVPDIHRLFNLHKCDWIARDPGTYSEEIVREFYASYVATLRGSIFKRSKPLAYATLTSTLVRWCPVDISPAMIRRFFYGPTAGHSWSLNTAEFDYRWDIMRSGAFGGILAARALYYGWQCILCRWQACGMGRSSTVGHPEGYIKFCGQVLLVAVRSYCGPIGQSIEVRSSDGHPAASHPAVDAKVNSQVQGQNGAPDGGDDGPEAPVP